MNDFENKDYLQTLISLKKRILQAQYNSYSAVNSEMILAYLDIGKTISEKVKIGWGTSVIKQLSIDLQAEFNGVQGFSERNLRRMKYVYEELQANAIWPQLVAKLHWGHISLIFTKIKDKNEREFYLQKAQTEAWSRIQNNMENMNAVVINEGISQKERLMKLNKIAIRQMKILQDVHHGKLLKL